MVNIAFFGKLVNIFMMVNILHTLSEVFSQPAITCSKSTIETLEQGVKYVSHLDLVFLLLTLSK